MRSRPQITCGGPVNSFAIAQVAGGQSRPMELARSGLNPGEQTNWYYLAPIFVEAGDVAGYDRHRRALLDRYGSTDSVQVAERTAKACLLLPGPSDVIGRAAELAGFAVNRGAEDAGLLPFYRLAAGLAEYRLGHFAAAEKRLRDSLAYRDQGLEPACTGPISCLP